MHRPEKPPARPVTAREIARKLGVSQPTVSRVLSGAPGYTFAEETRRRILEEAERMGYRPHAVARSLRERRTRVIGFYSWYGHLDARNAFQAEIIGSLQRECCENDHFLLLHNFVPGTPPGDIFGELTCGRIDALVIHTRDEDPLVDRLATGPLPVVAIADQVARLPSVVCDDRAGLCQAVAHLADRGHRCIAFLGPTERLASVERRRDAYREAMEEHGWEPVCVPVTYEAAEPALDVLRRMAPRPTAVCCWNDVTALNLLRAFHHAGLRAPDDLAVIGFDGLLDTRVMVQDLTTVLAGWSHVTHAALDTLHALIGGEAVQPLTTLPVTLRIGETT